MKQLTVNHAGVATISQLPCQAQQQLLVSHSELNLHQYLS